MESLRVKLVTGAVTFEAEGPAEDVRALYEDFSDKVKAGWGGSRRQDAGGGADGGNDQVEDKSPEGDSNLDLPITSALRLFYKRTGLTADDLEAVLMWDGEAVQFAAEPPGESFAAAQTEWALLLALRNAIENDNLTVDPEDVRSMCQKTGFYDPTNFASNFKGKSRAKFFKEALVNQGDPVGLTPEGIEELGKLLRRMGAAS